MRHMKQPQHPPATLVQAAVLLAGSLVAIPAAAAVDPLDGSWRFSVTPYVWLPNINADLDYNLRPRAAALLQSGATQLSTEIGPNDYLSPMTSTRMIPTCASPVRRLASHFAGNEVFHGLFLLRRPVGIHWRLDHGSGQTFRRGPVAKI
jgi:hypothetical protein